MSLADSDASSFDPPVPPDNMAIWTMLLFYDQLVRVAPDGLSLEPGLATEWSASEDGLQYTFKLRDAAFHDGTPVTSADVKYCLERAAKGETAWQFILSVIDTVDTPDKRPPSSTFFRLGAVRSRPRDLRRFHLSEGRPRGTR